MKDACKSQDLFGGSLPDPMESPTLTVPEAAVVLRISRAAAYAGVRRGDIPSLRIGHRVMVPTIELCRMLGHLLE